MTDLDLFCGARGWEALSRDLVDAVGVELDVNACATSRAAGFETVCADVAALEPGDVVAGPVRLLLSSPPCQTFSATGSGAGRLALDVVLEAVESIGAGRWPAGLLGSTGDPRTGLVVEPLRYALALRPEAIVWEQVPSVLAVWEAAASVLRAAGYGVAVGVLSAERYGVPQTRRRAVLVASRVREVALPRPGFSRYDTWYPQRLDAGVEKWVSMAEAFGVDDGFVVVSNYSTGGDAAVRGVRAGGQPAATVTSKFDGCRVVRGGDSRPLSSVEAARLQSFPEAYPFAGYQVHQRVQIGNAVPPLLGRRLIEAALGVN